MPIYEYQCQKCHHVDEYLMKFSDPDPTQCEKCHGPVAKLVSQTSFALKGEGWYVTDYKPQTKQEGKEDAKPADSKTTEAAGAEKPAGESKTEPSPTKTEAASAAPKVEAAPAKASPAPAAGT
jgi:putative FmdB family regulatory protein